MTLRRSNRIAQRARLAAAVVLFAFLCACLPQRPDPETLRRVESLQTTAAGHFSRRSYAAAADTYAELWSLQPQTGQIVLDYALSREHLQEYGAAADLYRTFLADPAQPEALRRRAAYRLALLEDSHLNRPDAVILLLALLPEETPEAADLRAVIALQQNDPRRALQELNRARSKPLTDEMASIILYHAARAYHLAGETDRVRPTLYEAINHASFAPIAKEIEMFRDSLNRGN